MLLRQPRQGDGLIACGCSKKRKALAGLQAGVQTETVKPKRVMAPAPEPQPKTKTRWRTYSGDESVTFSTIYEARAWARSHPGWTVETIKVPV